MPNSDHPAYKFVDTFIKGVMNDFSFADNLQTLLATVPEVWKEETLRNDTLCILTSIATNQMLHQKHFGTDSLSQAIHISKAIITLENQDKLRDEDILTIFYYPNIAAKFKNLSNHPKASGKRDVLKFLSRKVECSCLKEMYSNARRESPKSCLCSYCEEVKERDQLLKCSGCMLTEYCSLECQAADWEREHAESCPDLSGYQHAQQIR